MLRARNQELGAYRRGDASAMGQEDRLPRRGSNGLSFAGRVGVRTAGRRQQGHSGHSGQPEAGYGGRIFKWHVQEPRVVPRQCDGQVTCRKGEYKAGGVGRVPLNFRIVPLPSLISPPPALPLRAARAFQTEYSPHIQVCSSAHPVLPPHVSIRRKGTFLNYSRTFWSRVQANRH